MKFRQLCILLPLFKSDSLRTLSTILIELQKNFDLEALFCVQRLKFPLLLSAQTFLPQTIVSANYREFDFLDLAPNFTAPTTRYWRYKNEIIVC